MQNPKRTIVVSGANRGMGLEYVRQYTKNPQNQVVALVRNVSTSNQLSLLKKKYPNSIEILECDITSDTSMSQLKDKYKKIQLGVVDLLICNAGYFDYDISNFDSNSSTSMLSLYNINAVGNFRLFRTFRNYFRESGAKTKVIFVSSIHGSFGACKTSTYLGYKMSRAATNMLAKTISQETRVLSVCVHPGMVNTDPRNAKDTLTPEEAVTRLIKVYDSLNESLNGKFLFNDGSVQPF